MARSHDIRARVKARRFTKCEIDGCPRFVHGVSRWCVSHGMRAERHGHPLGRAIRKSETQPYARVVERFIRANANHPALALVFEELNTLLAEGAQRAAASNGRPRCDDWRWKLDCELQRVHQHGVTGREVFKEVGALWFLARSFPKELPPLSRQFHFATARAALGLAPRPGRWSPDGRTKRSTQRFSTPVLEHLGRSLTTSLAGVLRSAEIAFDQHASELAQRRRSLAAALEKPFS